MVASWLWVGKPGEPTPDQLAGFAVDHAVTEVFVSVPWLGPTAITHSHAQALRRKGVTVAALGGDPGWARSPSTAQQWAQRATALSDRIHLDIEPWTLPDFPDQAAQLLDGVARAVSAVRAVEGVKSVEVDLPGTMLGKYSSEFAKVARAADATTVMAYRDRAPAVLALARPASRILPKGYRVAVDVTLSATPSTSFADDGRVVLDRETRAVVTALKADSRFRGMAIHDLTDWYRLKA